MALAMLESHAGLDAVDDPDAVPITSGCDAVYPALPTAAMRRKCKVCGKAGCNDRICPVRRKEYASGALRNPNGPPRSFQNPRTRRQPAKRDLIRAVNNGRAIRMRALGQKKSTGRSSLTTGRRVPLKRPVNRNETVLRLVGMARNIGAHITSQIENMEQAAGVHFDPTNVHASLDEDAQQATESWSTRPA